MSWEFDTGKFDRAMGLARSTSRRGEGELLAVQARGVAKTLLEITPPSRGSNTSQTGARRAGERTIAADVAKVLAPVRATALKGRPATVNPSAAVDAARSPRTGRVLRAIGPKIPVTFAVYRAEVRNRQARVGRLAAGWAPAARKLGVTVAAWVGRHQGRGSGGEVVVGPQTVTITLSNETEFIDQVSGMRRRVQWALDLQANRMIRAVDAYWAKKMKKAGFSIQF